jgi:arylsulfatase A
MLPRMPATRRAFLSALPAALGAQTSPKPNILFILADDLGYTGVRCFGGHHARTPRLDLLAAEGVRFTQAYVQPQCTPTRASLLTGQHTARNRMWHVIPYYDYPYMRLREPAYRENLGRGTPTLAAALRAAGYFTGIIGKWHLTTNEDGHYEQLFPEAALHYGFDWAAPRNNPRSVQSRGDKGVDQFTNEACDFLERHRDRPFFLYLSHHTIHGPVLAPEALRKKYRAMGYRDDGLHNTTYLAALEHMDTGIGRVLDKLKELGLDGNTIVVFLSDNGGVHTVWDNAPLRAGKGSLYEGGIRVPCIVRWPGVVKPGTVRDTPLHVVDWYPTLLDAAGAKPPAGHTLDGVSMAAHLRGGSAPKRDRLYWYMPLYDIQWGAVPGAIVREGDWKLIEFFGDYVDIEQDYEYTPRGRVELYNLRNDTGERNNLAAKMPERVKAMRGALNEWIDSTGAGRPTPNPNYDPERRGEIGRRR